MTRRFVSFMDILGFGDMVDNEELEKILSQFKNAQYSVESAVRLGQSEGTKFIRQKSPLLSFSFSDTFVLCSHDDSDQSFLEIVIATNILSRQLFAIGMPIRGAISIGEAEAIPDTQHFIGKAIIKAARLEKIQNWFGVLIDNDCFSSDRQQILYNPLIQTLLLRYKVPFKDGFAQDQEQFVVNWRLNLQVKNGIKSLFRESPKPEIKEKIDNTLAFSKYVVANRLHNCYCYDRNKKIVLLPWLKTICIGDTPPEPNTPYGIDDGF